MRLSKWIMVAGCTLILSACGDSDDGSAEQTGEAIDEAVEGAADAVSDAADAVEDATN